MSSRPPGRTAAPSYVPFLPAAANTVTLNHGGDGINLRNSQTAWNDLVVGGVLGPGPGPSGIPVKHMNVRSMRSMQKVGRGQ